LLGAVAGPVETGHATVPPVARSGATAPSRPRGRRPLLVWTLAALVLIGVLVPAAVLRTVIDTDAAVLPDKVITPGPVLPNSPSAVPPSSAGSAPDLTHYAIISLRSKANGRFVAADNGGTAPLIAYVDVVGSWEAFEEIDLGNGDIALRAGVNSKFVTASYGASSQLIANSTKISTAQTFHIVDNGDGTISIQARSNGKYVTVPPETAGPLTNTKADIGPAEKFTRAVIGQVR
jgi:hypothetical protein